MIILAMPQAVFALEPVQVGVSFSIQQGGTAELVADSGSPAPSSKKIWVEDGQTGSFALSFSSVGEYSYTMRQIPDNRGLIYDKSEYKVKIFVQDVNGKLEAIINIYDGKTGLKVGRQSNGTGGALLGFVNKPPADPKKDKDKSKGLGTDDDSKGLGTDGAGTGDNSQIMLWLMLALTALAGVFALSLMDIQWKRQERS